MTIVPIPNDTPCVSHWFDHGRRMTCSHDLIDHDPTTGLCKFEVCPCSGFVKPPSLYRNSGLSMAEEIAAEGEAMAATSVQDEHQEDINELLYLIRRMRREIKDGTSTARWADAVLGVR